MIWKNWKDNRAVSMRHLSIGSTSKHYRNGVQFILNLNRCVLMVCREWSHTSSRKFDMSETQQQKVTACVPPVSSNNNITIFIIAFDSILRYSYTQIL